jgi:pyridoxine/pyridoxamine 5'-phosphate oxidase
MLSNRSNLGVQGASFPDNRAATGSRQCSDRRLGQPSAPLEPPHAFERSITLHSAKLMAGAIPRPPNWTGYRLRFLIMEFWQDRTFRLHDRVEFRRAALGQPWHKTRLYP